MRHRYSLLIICAFLLSGCAQEPYAEIPTNQRLALMAQAQASNKIHRNDIKKMSVSEMLAKVRDHSAKAKKPKHVEHADYYLKLVYEASSASLNDDQQQQISELLQTAGNDKQYVLEVAAGPAAQSNPVKAVQLSQARLKAIKSFLRERVKEIDMKIDPKMAENTVYMQFLYNPKSTAAVKGVINKEHS